MNTLPSEIVSYIAEQQHLVSVKLRLVNHELKRITTCCNQFICLINHAINHHKRLLVCYHEVLDLRIGMRKYDQAVGLCINNWDKMVSQTETHITYHNDILCKLQLYATTSMGGRCEKLLHD